MEDLKYLKIGITIFISMLMAAFVYTAVIEYRANKAAEKLAHEIKIEAEKLDAQLKRDLEAQRIKALQQEKIRKKQLAEQQRVNRLMNEKKRRENEHKQDVIRQKRELCEYWIKNEKNHPNGKFYREDSCTH